MLGNLCGFHHGSPMGNHHIFYVQNDSPGQYNSFTKARTRRSHVWYQARILWPILTNQFQVFVGDYVDGLPDAQGCFMKSSGTCDHGSWHSQIGIVTR